MQVKKNVVLDPITQGTLEEACKILDDASKLLTPERWTRLRYMRYTDTAKTAEEQTKPLMVDDTECKMCMMGALYIAAADGDLRRGQRIFDLSAAPDREENGRLHNLVNEIGHNLRQLTGMDIPYFNDYIAVEAAQCQSVFASARDVLCPVSAS